MGKKLWRRTTGAVGCEFHQNTLYFIYKTLNKRKRKNKHE